MSHTKPPTIAALTAGYLRRTEDAETLTAAADALGEVQPHEVTIGYRAEPRLAWQESLQVLTAFGRKAQSIPAPAEWGTLVARQDGVAALPFALANYPQRVRDLANLLTAGNLGDLLPKSTETTPLSSGLSTWGNKHAESGELPHILIVAATYRAARDFDKAQEILSGLKKSVGVEWQTIIANEEAALLWHRGDFAGATKVWFSLPDSPPVRFNRGMASLFLGRAAEAKTELAAAVAALPETGAWHHLASLYLSLAEMRG
jgi:tetratricopeptide (TPR) repeat protein